MKSFALIVNPVTIEQLKKYWPAARFLPDFLLRQLLKGGRPFKIAQLRRIKSILGMQAQGYIILCPISLRKTPEILKEGFVLDNLLEASHIAERLGANIIGLAGFDPVLNDRDYNALIKKIRIPVTDGKALAAWSVFESIYRVAKTKHIDLKDMSLAVIGAKQPLGGLCARKLSDVVKTITLVAKQKSELEKLKESISIQSAVEIILEEDAGRAARNSDIVVNFNGLLPDLIQELKPSAILCDIQSSCEGPAKANRRRDITFIRGGLVKLPYPPGPGMTSAGLPDDIICARTAEAVLLTLEEKFKNYSLGDFVNLDKLEEIADISARHGFEVWVPEAPLL